MVPHGIPIYVALEPANMRMGFERLGGLCVSGWKNEPRTRALFAFIGKCGTA